MKKTHRWAALAAGMIAMGGLCAYGSANPRTGPVDIPSEVQHRLLSLPYYTVFDNLAYRVDGTQVTIMGQVVNPALPDEAVSAVKEVPGVTTVINDIQILPPSSMDARIRRAVFRAIYGDPALQRYGEPTVPSIHIIVDNGTVTLVGMVATESDRDEAYIRTKTVPGTFGVNNDLRVNPGI